MKKIIFALALCFCAANTSSLFAQNQEVLTTLAAFGAGGAYATELPAEDKWVITDLEASTEDFEALRGALDRANGREISIVLLKMEEVPVKALGSDKIINKSVVSIECPAAKRIGNLAFRNFVKLKEVKLPVVTVIKANAMANCPSISYVELSTAPKNTLSVVQTNGLKITNSEAKCKLVVGRTNKKLITVVEGENGSLTFTPADGSAASVYNFKEIVVL